jgi:23S rRNA (pseudouridine1915-N3)-methyltransferase
MIEIIAVGQKQPAWVQTAFDDYAGRLSGEWKISLKEIKAEPRTLGKTVNAMKAAERLRIEAAITRDHIRVALDEHGKSLTTTKFSHFVSSAFSEQRGISFLIGGPDGLDPALIQNCQHTLRLSDMTLPHGMARVLLAEQLYRAWSIQSGHPYHRE